MKRAKKKSSLDAKRSVVIASEILAVLLALILFYSLVDRFIFHPPVKPYRAENNPPTRTEKPIQVSVRNECGAKNVAMSFTSYLRKRGFDVVETLNGPVFDRRATTVLDAGGNYQNALRVAEALGVRKGNVVTKLDPRSYVDVEVLIGLDFENLKPSEGTE